MSNGWQASWRKTKSFDYLCGDAVPRQLVSGDGPSLDTEHCPELADVVGGKVAGRSNSQEIIIFVDGNQAGGPGIGIQFAAVGSVVYRHAINAGVGQQIPLDWFLDREDHPYLENSGQSRSESSKKGNGQDSQELKAPKL
jgi:hypothetical protein